MGDSQGLVACMASTSCQGDALRRVAREFSPRIEWSARGFVVMDVGGLGRLHGDASAIGHALRRAAARRRLAVRVAVAATRVAAILMATARDGVSVVPRGTEARALAPLPLEHLEVLQGDGLSRDGRAPSPHARSRGAVARQRSSGHWQYRLAPSPASGEGSAPSPGSSGLPVAWGAVDAGEIQACRTARRWGLRTLGDLTALPAGALFERLGQAGLRLQRLAGGQDLRPVVPQRDGPCFEETLALDWPIEATTALSAVLGRVLEPLSAALERQDCGVAVLHVRLRLVTRAVYARRLELPTPLRDPAVLRTLILLDLESHPPPAGIDEVQVAAEPAPGPIVQFSLLERARPAPERLSTVLACVQALMGTERCGVPVLLDSHRPDAFAMRPFPIGERTPGVGSEAFGSRASTPGMDPVGRAVVRRFRRPVAARVDTADGRPVSVWMVRAGHGGRVVACAGPWRSSGAWWNAVEEEEEEEEEVDRKGHGGHGGDRACVRWDRDEWDVALATGGVYRLSRDRGGDRWFVDGVVD